MMMTEALNDYFQDDRDNKQKVSILPKRTSITFMYQLTLIELKRKINIQVEAAAIIFSL